MNLNSSFCHSDKQLFKIWLAQLGSFSYFVILSADNLLQEEDLLFPNGQTEHFFQAFYSKKKQINSICYHAHFS